MSNDNKHYYTAGFLTFHENIFWTNDADMEMDLSEFGRSEALPEHVSGVPRIILLDERIGNMLLKAFYLQNASFDPKELVVGRKDGPAVIEYHHVYER